MVTDDQRKVDLLGKPQHRNKRAFPLAFSVGKPFLDYRGMSFCKQNQGLGQTSSEIRQVSEAMKVELRSHMFLTPVSTVWEAAPSSEKLPHSK